MRRGRSKLPRGYYLVKTAKHGGLELEDSMPALTGMGQVSEEAVEKVEAGLTAAKVIGYGLLGVVGYFIVKAIARSQ